MGWQEASRRYHTRIFLHDEEERHRAEGGKTMASYECIEKPGGERPPFDTEVIVQLRNPDTMELFNARVIIYSSDAGHPGSDTLHFTAATTGRDKSEHPIKIIETLEEKAEDVQALPRQKLTLGQRKGTMLADMIRDRKK
jgi:hypothetical protein